MKPTLTILTTLLLVSLAFPGFAAEAREPNLLIITVDDMSADSVGVFGCPVKDTTPNIDRLAARGMRFHYAHTVVANCMPSRNVMWSGRYPHNNGVLGFDQIKKEDKDYPVLGDLLSEAGWFTGIREKVGHSTPYMPFPWGIILKKLPDGTTPHIKDASSYGASTKQGIKAAKEAGKPFCLMMNISDPHTPFYKDGDPHVPSKVFTPDGIVVPGFLPDDPVVRKELARYYSTVRRADDAVGAILDALKTSGEETRTVIFFVSDHGMPLPFAKTQMYHHSTSTPLIVLWPGVTKAGAADREHMISAVDFLPTLLDVLEIKQPPGFDGRSFAPLLRGEKQEARQMVFKEYDQNSGRQRTPMRAIQTRDWLYIFNPWSNGTRIMGGATAHTATCNRMRQLAAADPAVAARVALFDHRKPEEAYFIGRDADALVNLIAEPEHRERIAALAHLLGEWMVRTKDPLVDVFRKRDDAVYREKYMGEIEGVGGASRKERKKGKQDMDGEKPE
jgi:N-sulfoglucosamine sulfohydrolase